MMDQESIEAINGCIYKFGPTKHAEITLKNKTLGFSPLDSFNDPYESEFSIAHFFHSLEDEEKLLSPAITPLNKIQNLSKEYLDKIKVTCFSRTPVNNLMWAHYADNHKGICYAFDFSKQQPPFNETNIGWGGVIYSSYVPELKIYQDQTTEGMLPSLLSDVILTKAQEWSYEEEIRFYHTKDAVAESYRTEALKAVILGRRISASDRTNIRKWVDQYNTSNQTNVKVLYAHRIARTYSLGVHSIESFQQSSETTFSAKIPVLSGIKSEPLTTIAINDE